MLNSTLATRGIAVAPHSLAAQSAVDVMREGGNALEAMIAAAATIAVVYPHMNSIGGDGFWVISRPGFAPGGIDAAGKSAMTASIDWYAKHGLTDHIPFRGPMAALTVAGTVSGWGKAHELAKSAGGRLPMSRLLADAIYYAQTGIAVTPSQSQLTSKKLAELQDQPGFAQTFLANGKAPQAYSHLKQAALAQTLKAIAKDGTESFYRGKLARKIANDLHTLGSPITLADLNAHHAKLVDPLKLKLGRNTLLNMQPPSQGLISLMILGIMSKLRGWDDDPEGPAFIHAQVEATKQAFKIRDAHLTDPAWMKSPAHSFLDDTLLSELAANIDPHEAAPWGSRTDPGDTIWMGVIDGSGMSVSFIQSIYHEFGSGIVLPQTGINWQNRGCAFSLNPTHINHLAPGKKTFHTLNAAIAELANNQGTLVYGTMGGDGQPQTQATLYQRVMQFGDHLQQALSRPRWLLGRTWGQTSESLKLESRFSSTTFETLKAMGHDVQWLDDWDEAVGHAGMLMRDARGIMTGGFDPRSNGVVAGF
ncbi:gamma-glutamyltransferase family protein [Orrella daihaiensis]|uniref:Gamma-glutamyltransferase n=1 Tax=Orrella daihaiensis TaxID=2782176 RepID=A0ABY4AHV6_9BURK|nr:gamma-glutamyltransferase [Orrella daihaiensis]UOD49872.1 gamma-glutamyltransferase [Orrella daihaiensis]